MATIVTRSGKGSPLTHTEMDANLNNMNDQKIELTSDTGSCVFPNGTTAQRDVTPQAGYTRYNTTTGVLELYDGSNWINFVEQTSTTGSCVFPSGTTAQRDSIPSAGYSRWNTSTESVEVFDGTNWVGFGGASAINELNDATVSASDPTITTNPNAVGQLWINTTSGECYICTDATAGANVWTNIGGGSGNISPNDPPVITGLTVDTTAIASYTWADVNTGSTNTYTIAGATDPDGTDANIDYSIINISNANLTASGGVDGADITLTVATIGADINGVTFNIRVTDEAGGTTDSAQQSINLKSVTYTSATGGTVTTDGNYKVHTFTASGSFVVTTAGDTPQVEYLVIAGGGGGGSPYLSSAGAGGAGGYLSATGHTISATTYSISVGAGGAGGTANLGTVGGDSTFSTITSDGGGYGAGYQTSGGSGGSGGGSGGDSANTGVATSGQGYKGGTGAGTPNFGSGGGGGASEVGANGTGSVGGNGGDGLASSITGTATTRAGGGGGGNYNGGTGGQGGAGGGGDSDVTGGHGLDGSTNLGGGGGGGSAVSSSYSYNGGDGGSGVVIIRYQFQ